ncbi:MAG: hypothetical protein ACRD1G_17245 [Acidimicrobiales bacterium]
MHEGRALADINLSNGPLAAELEAFIGRRDPRLKNVQVKRAVPTGDIETRVQPHKRWYEITYWTDDDDEEAESPDQ